MVKFTPPTSDIIELKNEIKKLKERNDSLNNRDINLCRIANNIRDENFELKTDCKTLAQKLLQVKPELREWLEVNFKEYL